MANKDNQNKSINIHADHRARLRKRFVEEGIDSFEHHNILELLLFYSIPRVDTNPIAHRLLNEFGTISGVFDAPYTSLLEVEGVGESTANLIKLVHGLIKVYEVDKISFDGISDFDEMGKYMVEYYKNQTEEVLVLLLINNSHQVYKLVEVCSGNANSVNVPIKEISAILHRYNAAAFVMVHNHPSGRAVPSKGDIAQTIHTESVFSALGFPMLEHIVVGGNKYNFIFRSSQTPYLINKKNVNLKALEKNEDCNNKRAKNADGKSPAKKKSTAKSTNKKSGNPTSENEKKSKKVRDDSTAQSTPEDNKDNSCKEKDK